MLPIFEEEPTVDLTSMLFILTHLEMTRSGTELSLVDAISIALLDPRHLEVVRQRVSRCRAVGPGRYSFGLTAEGPPTERGEISDYSPGTTVTVPRPDTPLVGILEADPR